MASRQDLDMTRLLSVMVFGLFGGTACFSPVDVKLGTLDGGGGDAEAEA